MYSDSEIVALARHTLKRLPGARKCDKGLPCGQAAVTVVTLENGKVTRLWGHAHSRQINTLARKNRSTVTLVERVVADGSGHGEIVRRDGTFKLEAFILVPVEA